MMRPIIEFCISNIVSGSQKAKEQLENDPNLDVIEYGCLGYCGKCSAKLFALVDGVFVTGSSTEELVNNIYQQIEENPVF
ncbi:YuzB family protein [Cytobacillus sp. Hz8]|uniref:YuzB family protein n=1 Tax=Cytobacillus sp. Hz8 TaxID=3347168 RepID=UPI0035E25B12